MNTRLFIGIAAALSWAPVEALAHLARPMPLFQVMALALFVAFFTVRLIAYVSGVCATHPWRSPAALLGAGAVCAWGVHLYGETSIWTVPGTAWLAVALLALGPLSLTVWAWQVGARNWVFVLAAVSVLVGGRLI